MRRPPSCGTMVSRTQSFEISWAFHASKVVDRIWHGACATVGDCPQSAPPIRPQIAAITLAQHFISRPIQEGLYGGRECQLWQYCLEAANRALAESFGNPVPRRASTRHTGYTAPN